MGLQWLKQVEQSLKEGGFRTEAGYPARRAVALSETVAAVNLQAMDGTGIRQVLVTVLTPRKLGLEQCQSKAAQALEILAQDGNQWEFDRWRYEDGIDCWVIEIRGIAVDEVQRAQMAVYIGDAEQPWVTDILVQQIVQGRFVYPHWQGEPSRVIPGKKGWILKMTQLLPFGELLPEPEGESFDLSVVRQGIRQTFRDCWWESYTSREKAEGTLIVRSAFCLSREVSMDGTDAV